MYFLKDLEDIDKFLEFFRSENQAKLETSPEGVNFLLQVASPHYGLCIKHYYFAGVHVFNYQ